MLAASLACRAGAVLAMRAAMRNTAADEQCRMSCVGGESAAGRPRYQQQEV